MVAVWIIGIIVDGLQSCDTKNQEPKLTYLIVHHLDHHQLPMHCCQASYHLKRSVLQHLVPSAVSKHSCVQQ